MIQIQVFYQKVVYERDIKEINWQNANQFQNKQVISYFRKAKNIVTKPIFSLNDSYSVLGALRTF